MRMKFLLSVFVLVVFGSLVQAQEKVAPPIVSLPPNELEVTSVKQIPMLLAERPLGWGAKRVKVDEAWKMDVRSKGKGIKIAVLDQKFDINHPYYSKQVKLGYNAMTRKEGLNEVAAQRNRKGQWEFHGTHCAGIVAEALPECEIVLIAVLNTEGSGSVADIAEGLRWAREVAKVDVCSLSLGGSQADTWIPPELKKNEAAGIISIVAAGNEGPGSNTDGYPARYPEAISVGATGVNNDGKDILANFSSRGKSVFTIDPGVNITSAVPDDSEGEASGTSMATPLTAAKCGAWLATHPQLAKKDRPAAYRKAVIEASPFKTRTDEIGYGLFPLTKLVTVVSPPHPLPTLPPGTPRMFTVGFADLSTSKQAELVAGGVTTLQLTFGGVPTVKDVEVMGGIFDKPKEEVVAPVVPMPTTKMPGFTWKVYNGQWGWVQDGIEVSNETSFPQKTTVPQMIPQNIPGCVGGNCSPSQSTRTLPWLSRLFK